MFLNNAGIITAGGLSERFNIDLKHSKAIHAVDKAVKKELVKLKDGSSVLYSAVKNFLLVENIKVILITYPENFKDQIKDSLLLLEEKSSIPFYYVKGGNTRQESVFNALKFLYELKDIKVEYVSIHDGSRPFVSKALIDSVLSKAHKYGACIPGLRSTDTLVKIDKEGCITSFIDRNSCYSVQTPQCFKFPDIYFSHVKAKDDNINSFTDDSSVFMTYGGSVFITDGELSNKKITFKSDLEDIKIT